MQVCVSLYRPMLCVSHTPMCIPDCVSHTPKGTETAPNPIVYRLSTWLISKNRGYFSPSIPPFFNTFNTKRGILPPSILYPKNRNLSPHCWGFVTPLCHPICHPIVVQDQKIRKNDQFIGINKMVIPLHLITALITTSSMQIQASQHSSSSHLIRTH